MFTFAFANIRAETDLYIDIVEFRDIGLYKQTCF